MGNGFRSPAASFGTPAFFYSMRPASAIHVLPMTRVARGGDKGEHMPRVFKCAPAGGEA
jgi:hypothetical protein